MSRASLVAPGLAAGLSLLPGLVSAHGGGQAPRVPTLQPPVEREYGDASAVPRLQRSVRLARHQATGSRLGFAGVLEVTTTNGNEDANGAALSGADYYDERYWRSMQPATKDAASAADIIKDGTTNGQ